MDYETDAPSLNRKRSPKGFCTHAILRVFVTFTWMAAMPLAVAAAPCDDFTFEFRAEPAFLAPSVVRLQTHPRSARLSIEIGDKFKEKPALDSAAAQAFCARLIQAFAIEQSSPPSFGFDGIQVRGNLRMAASPNVNFSFWSPDKVRHPRDFAVAESVFLLLESTTPSCLLNIYLEQLATYFPFGITVRRIAGPPLTLRVYGSLTIDDIDDFDRIIDSLPPNVPLVMDMTNFNNMGALLYQGFRRLLSRAPAAEWKVSPQAARQLRAVGVAAVALEIPQGLYCAGQPRRFSRR
jgi:hypothetical protein